MDLSSLRLPRSRERRAWVLAALGEEYALEFRANPNLGRFEVFVIADKREGCGLWTWLDTGLDLDRFAW